MIALPVFTPRILTGGLALAFVLLKCVPYRWPRWVFFVRLGLGLTIIGLTGQFSRLWTPLRPGQLVVAALIGYALFWLARILSSGLWLGDAADSIPSPSLRLGDMRYICLLIFHYLPRVIYEELIWRVALPVVWGGTLAGVVMSSFLFVFSHIVHRRVTIWQALEFAIFTFILATIFWRMQAFWVIVVIHLIRNVSIGLSQQHQLAKERHNVA